MRTKPRPSKPIERDTVRGAAAARATRRGRWEDAAPIAFRNRRGDRVDASSFTATEAKNEFGRALDIVNGGGVVVITKRDAPKAVLVSVEEFNALARTAERTLDTLSNEFDAMLARMQTRQARAGMKAAFDASPERLGRAAVAAARKRG
ncbi:MAG: type II toxin-antitoxin system Phd/YefM family antitoxin [Candidatus Rokubacteria bacterium]|nr:type II toxin-antitoxin system Phd/YefM family antitoxin [Candidatus Rokubacteria bacterium]